MLVTLPGMAMDFSEPARLNALAPILPRQPSSAISNVFSCEQPLKASSSNALTPEIVTFCTALLEKPLAVVLPLPTMTSDTQFVWLPNTPPSIVPSLPCQTTSRMLLQLPKAQPPTLVTLDGISTRARALQYSNALGPMVSTPAPIVALVIASQTQNAELPMLVTLPGMAMDLSVRALLNALVPMLPRLPSSAISNVFNWEQPLKALSSSALTPEIETFCTVLLEKPLTFVLPLPTMTSDTQFVWPPKMSPLSVSASVFQTTSRSALQSLNALFEMLVRVEGISMD